MGGEVGAAHGIAQTSEGGIVEGSILLEHGRVRIRTLLPMFNYRLSAHNTHGDVRGASIQVANRKMRKTCSIYDGLHFRFLSTGKNSKTTFVHHFFSIYLFFIFKSIIFAVSILNI